MENERPEPSANALELLQQLRTAVMSQESKENSILQRQTTARIFSHLLETSRYSVTQLARRLEVAPQTVNRWKSGKSLPRIGQLNHLEGVLSSASPTSDRVGRDTHFTKSSSVTSGSAALEIAQTLGIHTFQEALTLQREARQVWVVKNEDLGHVIRGPLGNMILHALKDGTRFHYVFSRGSLAESSFREQVMPWIDEKSFRGSVVGYCLDDYRLAFQLGLSDGPGAWVAIEYSQTQVQRLQRPYDVYKVIPIREYTDAGHTRIKNEDGQRCWMELSSEDAWSFFHTLTSFCEKWERQPDKHAEDSKDGLQDNGVEVILVSGQAVE